jgi:hypothetical protein
MNLINYFKLITKPKLHLATQIEIKLEIEKKWITNQKKKISASQQKPSI